MAEASAPITSFNYEEAIKQIQEESVLKLENGTLAWEGLDDLLDVLDKSYIKSVAINNMKLIQVADLEDVIASLEQSKGVLTAMFLTQLDLRKAANIMTGLLLIVDHFYSGNRGKYCW